MLVRTFASVTEGEVIQWAYRLASTFGRERFVIARSSSAWMPSRHCLSRIESWDDGEGDPIYPDLGESFLAVHLAGSYYGVGYERGDLPGLFMIAEWLERNVPGGSVWYGGDSLATRVRPFGRKQRDYLLQHFMMQGHPSYISDSTRFRLTDPGETQFPAGRVPPPVCSFCRNAAVRSGLGESFAIFTCPGCGWGAYTVDLGRTWQQFEGYQELFERLGVDPFRKPAD
jgi:hypothetical protein